MRLLVCGGRNYNDAKRIEEEIVKLAPTVIISGGASGADTHAIIEAQVLGIPVIVYMADWKKYGRRAGPIRNKQMLEEGKPDMVLAFPGGIGTANMIKQAKAAGIKVIEIEEETK